jgi:hypothetical protein
LPIAALPQNALPSCLAALTLVTITHIGFSFRKVNGEHEMTLLRRILSYTSLFVFALLARDAFSAPFDPALLTAENYAKIENGMTLDEVKAILGHDRRAHGSKGSWTHTWTAGNGSNEKIDVYFKDGKVDRKYTNFSWAKTAKVDPPKTAPEKEPPQKSSPPGDDKFKEAVRTIRFGDKKQRHDALRKFVMMRFDAELAPQVTQVFISYLHDDDERTSSFCHEGLQKWVCAENADYFLKELRRNPKTNSPSDPDRERVNFAIDMLVKLKEPRAVEPLIKLLHGHLFDRSKAQDALIALGPELAEAEVLEHLNDSNNPARQAVHAILAKFKTSAADRLARYLADLHADSPQKRYTAAFAIGNTPVIPERRVEVAAELVALLNDNPGDLSDDVKKSTTDKARKRSGNSLMALVDEQAKHPANAAIAALAQWGGPENEPVLIKHLANKNVDLRYGAAVALGKFGTSRALPPLRAAQASEKVTSFAECCKDAIAAIQARQK